MEDPRELHADERDPRACVSRRHTRKRDHDARFRVTSAFLPQRSAPNALSSAERPRRRRRPHRAPHRHDSDSHTSHGDAIVVRDLPSPALSFAVPTTVSDHSTEDPTERAERDEQRSKILKRTEFAKVSFSFCLSPSLSLCSLGGWASARGEAWVARGEDASHSPQLCGQQRARRSTALPVDERAPAIVSSRAGIDGLSRWRVDSASRWPCFVATNFGGRVTLGFPPHSPQRAMTRSLLGAFTQRPGYRASSLDVASLDRGFATRLRVSHVSAFRSRHICCELLDSPSLYSLSTDHACTSYDACARVVQGKAQCHKCPPAEPRGPSRALKNSNSFWDFFC